jgi:hypothetical protein
MAPRKEAGKPPHAQAASENRKLRNRLSQKAFRARQNLRIQALESRLAGGPLCETQRVAELEERNRVLFEHLLSCHKKLESMQVTLQSFTDSTAALLGMSVRSNSLGAGDSTGSIANYDQQAGGDNAHHSNMASTTDSESSIRAQEHSSNLVHRDEESHGLNMSTDFTTTDVPDLDISIDSTAIDDGLAPSALCNIVDNPYSLFGIPSDRGKEAVDIISSAQIAMEYPRSFDQTILYPHDGSHRSFSHSYTGYNTDRHLAPRLTTTLSFSGIEPSSYDFAVARGPVLVKGAHSEVRRTNSAFSDHFNVVEHFLQQNWKNSEAILTNLDDWSVHLTTLWSLKILYMSILTLICQTACGRQFLSC